MGLVRPLLPISSTAVSYTLGSSNPDLSLICLVIDLKVRFVIF